MMDREKALEILGLPTEASPEDIDRRIIVLYKKFKALDKDERGYTLSDVEAAYKSLRGIQFRDEKAEQAKKYRESHPNPLLKLIGADEEKARNFIYYHKWHVLIALAAIGLVVSIVLTIVNKTEPDLKVIVAGELYLSDTSVLETRIEEEVEGVTEALVQNIVLSENSDPQTAMAMQMKFTVEISAGNNDIFIMDEAMYRRTAELGAFKPIGDMMGDIGALGYNEEDIADLKVSLKTDDGSVSEPELYGLDVTGSALLKNTGLESGRLIVAIGHSAEDPENAVAFIRKLLSE